MMLNYLLDKYLKVWEDGRTWFVETYWVMKRDPKMEDGKELAI